MKKLTFTDQLVATQMHSKEGEIIDFAGCSNNRGNCGKFAMLILSMHVVECCSVSSAVRSRDQVNPVVTKDKNVETWMTDGALHSSQTCAVSMYPRVMCPQPSVGS